MEIAGERATPSSNIESRSLRLLNIRRVIHSCHPTFDDRPEAIGDRVIISELINLVALRCRFAAVIREIA